MGVVELTKGEIVELKPRIDRKPTTMRSKVLLEAELDKKIDIYIAVRNLMTWQHSSIERFLCSR